MSLRLRFGCAVGAGWSPADEGAWTTAAAAERASNAAAAAAAAELDHRGASLVAGVESALVAVGIGTGVVVEPLLLLLLLLLLLEDDDEGGAVGLASLSFALHEVPACFGCLSSVRRCQQ